LESGAAYQAFPRDLVADLVEYVQKYADSNGEPVDGHCRGVLVLAARKLPEVAVPHAVRDHVTWPLNRLREHEAALHGVQLARGNGHILAPEPKATTAQWSDWFDNPFKAIKAASEARGTPNDYDRALDVLRRSAEWENFDFDHYLDDVLQEIGGETNIVCQYDGDRASGRRFRAAYDEGPEVVASADRSLSPDM
jgi:hypothetical protein